jgi:hypothetical protein
MKSTKLLGRYVCRPVMALSVSFLLMEASSAADITKLFLASGQVDLAREVVDCRFIAVAFPPERLFGSFSPT